MMKVFLASLLFLGVLPGLLPFSHQLRLRSFNSLTRLNAKKKGSKLVSDDFLSTLESTFDDTTGVAAAAAAAAAAAVKEPVQENEKTNKKDESSEPLKPPPPLRSEESAHSTVTEAESVVETEATKKKKKKKGGGKKDYFADLDAQLAAEKDSKHEAESTEDTADVDVEEELKAKLEMLAELDENKDGQEQDDGDDDADTDEDSKPKYVDPEGLTIEQRVRKERPPSRIRFAESAQPDFVMMSLEGVGLMYGNDVVLRDATFGATTGERVGLVGPNGSGKTTQLRILAGDIEPTTGDVVKSSRNLRVAFLRQEFADDLTMTNTLREELYTSFSEERQLLKDITTCEEELAKTTDDPDKMEAVLNKMQQLQDKAISQGVYALDSKVDKVMDAAGFTPQDGSATVSSFSGGWKMRVGIAKILLKEPNVLLLDEPTNHLDLDSVNWLEDFLQKQSIPMVIVSHDREFLDRVCNKIVDVEDGKTVSYQGNYSKFLELKKNRMEVWRDKYDKQVRHVKEEEKWIKKAKNDPNMSQQVKAKETALEKYKTSEEWVEQPPKDKKFRFRFPPAPRCGQSIVEASKLSHGYGTGKYQTLFENVDVAVERGERIGFVGPNGSGKSTMMRLVMGIEKPNSGFAEFGGSNVQANYYQQNQADAMDLDRTVLETVMDGAPSDLMLTDIRALLGQFMFKGDDVDKKLRVLSGGEKARVALCKMMLTPANLLCLDEPTNHLDITSKEVLEDALLHFEGAVLFISHDRYFMSQIANRVFAFENKGVIRHDCDYHDYMEGKSDGLKEKVTSRYVEGDRFKITNAKEVIMEEVKSKKNFGGSGVTSGNLFKGIKNHKRFKNAM